MVGAMSVEISAPLLRTQLTRLVDERGTRGLLPGIVKRLAHGDSGAVLAAGRDIISQSRAVHSAVRQYFPALAERLQGMLDAGERSSKLRFRAGQRLHAQIGSVLGPFLLMWNELAATLRRFHQDLADLRGDAKLAPDLLIELKSAADSLTQTGEQLYQLLREADANTVTWVEFGRSERAGWCALYAAPVSVGAIMEKAFWPVIESAVLTSATLTVGGGFGVLRNTLGLDSQPPERLRELVLDSPFSLDRQMRALVPVFLPEPRQGGAAYAEVLTETITRLVERFERGTLILCTSNELVDRLTTALGPVARRAGRRLLSQGASASLGELVAEFRRRGNAILIGAASFWEGIDVVGDALQILIVTRIPFDVPTEPWVAARTEALQDTGHDPFLEYSLPVAALRLKQGVGRLIRHNDDRGVAILADPRLFKTRYGRLIRESLPVEARPVYSEDELFRETERFFGNPVT
jgi:ATP-dependent DNA helicase DinG